MFQRAQEPVQRVLPSREDGREDGRQVKLQVAGNLCIHRNGSKQQEREGGNNVITPLHHCAIAPLRHANLKSAFSNS
jgi:hypothetical protein